MKYAVTTHSGIKLASGETDNPYQVRNLLQQYLSSDSTQIDPYTLQTPLYKIWCSSELPLLLNPTPRIVNDTSPRPKLPADSQPGQTFTLAQLCLIHKLNPAKCRQRLRKHYGVQHARYSWPDNEVPYDVLGIRL